jgi:hypothetical protein
MKYFIGIFMVSRHHARDRIVIAYGPQIIKETNAAKIQAKSQWQIAKGCPLT